MVTWVVSNCGKTAGAKKRLQLVSKMMKYGIEVDGRGKCFNKSIPVTLNGNKFTDKINFISKYKFYLAFENSHHCSDYITEKLYTNSFLAGSVPIVWGPKKSDYEAVLPKHSFIFFDDYKDNITELAEYLNYLDRNQTAYAEYFKWRLLKPENIHGNQHLDGNCKLCIALKKQETFNFKRNIIKSIYSWIFENENLECFNATSKI